MAAAAAEAADAAADAGLTAAATNAATVTATVAAMVAAPTVTAPTDMAAATATAPPGHGGGHGHGPGKGRGRRARRGDLRAVTLLLLAEEPMHGYQIMSTIAERTGRHWTPGPGATYPTISLLEDEGLISVAPVDGKKTATITDLGRAEVEEHRAEWAAILDRYADDDASPRSPHIIRGAMMDLRDAVKHVDFNGTDADRDRLIEILRDTTAKVRTLTAGNRADTDTGSDTDGTA